MTYGQRCDLGRIAENPPASELAAFKEIMNVMHPGGFDVKFTEAEVDYVEQVIEKIAYWAGMEQKLLKVEPDPLQKRAGIREMSERVKDLGVLHTLCEKFGKSPTEVLSWNYADVFGMLFVDKEKAVFQKNYDKLAAEEAERKAKQKRRR